MRKKLYVSPIVEELMLEDILWSSGEDVENEFDDLDWGNTGGEGDFDGEDDFVF